ncbi:hypothetical protein WJX72_011458 [[Myrmecia] bisecta]|uniref:Proteasome inhibitor PI31 subunit n=1 Tax=[Myrmecia] bisecta TaxID=41462 RepID=A0AAW1PU16_9CHLO
MSGVSAHVVSALIRAADPQFRSPHDRLAFAVHSYLLADGYKLIAVGRDAEDANGDKTKEVSTAGWNSSDEFAFRYAPAQASGKDHTLLVKALPMGDTLVVHSLKQGQDGQQQEEPKVLDLDTCKYTTDKPGVTEGYKDLDGLVKELTKAFHSQASSAAAGRTAQDSTAAAHQHEDASTSGRGSARSPHEDPLREGPIRTGGPSLGASDVVPPGFRAPGQSPNMGPIPGIPGFGGGGGMHVGPNDPLFGGHPGIRPPGGMGGGPGRGGLPAGARWDPIAPQGLRGFNPDDFQRHDFDPDIQQPGPGRGADYDRMFG